MIMPYITINLLEGHSKDEKVNLHRSVTEAVVSSLNLPEDYVRIQLVEMKPEHNSIAGQTIEELTNNAN